MSAEGAQARTEWCPHCDKAWEPISNPLNRFRETPGQLANLVSGVSQPKLDKRPSPDEWSIHEVLAHLADAEVVRGFRFRKILAEPDPEIALFDERMFTKNLAPHKRPVSALLETFRVVRDSNALMLEAVSKVAWNRAGRFSADVNRQG